MKRTLTIAATSAALLAGAAAGVAFGTPTIVGAQDDAVTDPTAPAPEAMPPDVPPGDPGAGPRAWMRQALDELVAEGVLTQEQADAVVTKLEAAKPGWPGRGGPGGHGHGGHGHGGHPVAAAEALGMTPAELFEELRAGKTIAQVAAERGVDLQAVIDAIVAKQTERLDAAVAEGRLTQEQADERKAGLVDRVTEMVQTVPPERPGRRGPRDGGLKDDPQTEQQDASTEA